MRAALVVLPWDVLVTVNRRSINRKVLSNEYRKAKEAIYMIACGQVRGERPRFPTEAVDVVLDFYVPDFRRRDFTNYYKLILDALEGVVYADDFQIREITGRRHDPTDDTAARCEVTVRSA